MDKGAWQATVHKVPKSQTQLKQLSMHAYIVDNVVLALVNLVTAKWISYMYSYDPLF